MIASSFPCKPLLLIVTLGLLAACGSSDDGPSGQAGAHAGSGGKSGGKAGATNAGGNGGAQGGQAGGAQGGSGGMAGVGIGGSGSSSGAPEVCGDGLDNNGNGAADEGCPCQEGATQSCFVGPPEAAGKGACALGTQTCVKSGSGEVVSLSWGACQGSKGPVEEVCGDGIDNDCNGKTDQQDGCGCADGSAVDCSSACGPGAMVCKDGKLSACSAPQPGAEVCDGKDNDCDGQIDEACCVEGDTVVCTTECGVGSQSCAGGKLSECVVTQPYPNPPAGCAQCKDGETLPCNTKCGSGTMVCVNGKLGACSAPQPSTEECDGKDNDCDGQIDENLNAKSCQGENNSPGKKDCVNGVWGPCACYDGMSYPCNDPKTGGSGQMKCSNGTWGVCTCFSGAQQQCTDALGGQGTIKCTDGAWGECECKEGAIQPCTAADGSQGHATCIGGKYGTCGCAAGATQQCKTPGGGNGSKFCGIDGGDWSPCCPVNAGGATLCQDGAIQSCDENTEQVCCGGAWGPCQPNQKPPTQDTACIDGSVVLACGTSPNNSQLTECRNNKWQCFPDDDCKPAECDTCLKTQCAAEMASADPACQLLLDTTFQWLAHCGPDRTAYFQQLSADKACPSGVVQQFNVCKLTKCASGAGKVCSFD